MNLTSQRCHLNSPKWGAASRKEGYTLRTLISKKSSKFRDICELSKTRRARICDLISNHSDFKFWLSKLSHMKPWAFTQPVSQFPHLWNGDHNYTKSYGIVMTHWHHKCIHFTEGSNRSSNNFTEYPQGQPEPKPGYENGETKNRAMDFQFWCTEEVPPQGWDCHSRVWQ